MTDNHLNDDITITDDGIKIAAPDSPENSIQLFCEDIPERLAPHIDFFHGRPALYTYTNNQEEPAHILLLPTKEDPYIHTLKNGSWENDELFQKLRNDEPIYGP